MPAYRGVKRLDGVRGKKELRHPLFELEVFRKKKYCIEESTCDISGLFGAHSGESAPGELFPPLPPRYAPAWM